MATGGDVDVADSGVACSLCLEPYGGREAKVLPCLHTFCLPCLSASLLTHTDTDTDPKQVANAHTREEEGRQARWLTCPTCRLVVPLPPGEVAGFQSNSILDSSSSSREEAPQPVPCTLCDGDHTAQVHCGQCQNKVCSQCRRYHDKCCQGGQVRVLQDLSDSSSSSSTAQKPSPGQVRQQQQLQRVEEAVKKLGEEERKLKQEREAMDHSINVRYATLLHHAADARDVCCRSLGEACDGLTARLLSSMAEARHAQATLQRQLSPSQPAPVATAQQRAALFLQGELQTILDRDLDTCSLLHHHTEDNPSLMTHLLHPFMGHVVKCSQASGPALSQHPSGSLHTEDHRGAVSSVRADAENLDDLCKRVGDLTGQVYLLKSTCTLLSNATSQFWTDQSSLQREVTTLKDKNATLTTQQAALQIEVTAMKDKNAIVLQDLAVLTAEKDNAYAQLTQLRTDLTSVQTDTSGQQTDILQLKADHGDVLTKLSTVQTDMTALQGGQSSMKDMAAETALQNKGKAMTVLEPELNVGFTDTQVGFHADMSRKKTTYKKKTLICNNVLVEKGGGYDPWFGVFTAPKDGIYYFLATTSPQLPDTERIAKLAIIAGREEVGRVSSKGRAWATGHAVVRASAGCQVRLSSFDEEECTFGAKTSFTGMLLHAEV